jgi:hypothetical protein
MIESAQGRLPPADSANDIFVSYAREDQERVRILVDALAALGWSIFWDRKVPTGRTWRAHIGSALQRARCVVVVWSRSSVESRFVAEEADLGLRRQALMPVLIDPVEPPFGFGSVHAADLNAWRGEADDPAWLGFVADLRAVLGGPPAPPQSALPPPVTPLADGVGVPPMPASSRPPFVWPRRWASTAAALVLIAALVTWWVARPSPGEAAGDKGTATADASVPPSVPSTHSTEPAKPAAQPVEGARPPTKAKPPVDTLCVDLLQRQQLGEVLGGADQLYFNNKCTGR